MPDTPTPEKISPSDRPHRDDLPTGTQHSNASPVDDKPLDGQPLGRRSQKTSAKIALLALFGLGASWFMAQQAFTAKLPAVDNDTGLQVRSVTGTVIKTLEQFSLTTNEGGQYHVFDPNNLIDGFAKKRGIKGDLYEMNDVCLKGVISPVGNYGHLGRYERQIVITHIC